MNKIFNLRTMLQEGNTTYSIKAIRPLPEMTYLIVKDKTSILYLSQIRTPNNGIRFFGSIAPVSLVLVDAKDVFIMTEVDAIKISEQLLTWIFN